MSSCGGQCADCRGIDPTEGTLRCGGICRTLVEGRSDVMDSMYEPYWQQAMQLRHQTHDMIANHEHPMARSLHTETIRLVDDIERNRAPRAIEDRIKVIQHQL